MGSGRKGSNICKQSPWSLVGKPAQQSPEQGPVAGAAPAPAAGLLPGPQIRTLRALGLPRLSFFCSGVLLLKASGVDSGNAADSLMHISEC